MRVCVYGAGAIGAYLASALADAGCDVTMIARGPHLAAMQANGLTLQIDGTERNVRIACTDDPSSVGPQDFVILTVKAHSVAPVVDSIATLLGPDTAVVTAQNGILWWYFHAYPGPWENANLDSADPGRRIWTTLGPERAIGCVVYPSCEIVEPGVVRLAWSNGARDGYTVYKSHDPRRLSHAEAHQVDGTIWTDTDSESAPIVYYRIE